MSDRCPGRDNLQRLDSVTVPCPDCGRFVEIFSDEPRARCRCGGLVLRETVPKCAAWCASAATCLGQAVDVRELGQQRAHLQNDPQVQQCLAFVRQRLQQGREEVGP